MLFAEELPLIDVTCMALTDKIPIVRIATAINTSKRVKPDWFCILYKFIIIIPNYGI
jgi:hypothetical protein